jgi:hypothetical protein
MMRARATVVQLKALLAGPVIACSRRRGVTQGGDVGRPVHRVRTPPWGDSRSIFLLADRTIDTIEKSQNK